MIEANTQNQQSWISFPISFCFGGKEKKECQDDLQQLNLKMPFPCCERWVQWWLVVFRKSSEGSYIQISPFPFTTLVFTTVWYLHPHVESKWSTKAIKHTSSHRQHLQLFIISMGVITSPKSPFNCRDSILKDQICCQLTFCGCFLQCEATCLHASHAQNSVVDPVHVGGHLSVDIKHIVLKRK